MEGGDAYDVPRGGEKCRAALLSDTILSVVAAPSDLTIFIFFTLDQRSCGIIFLSMSGAVQSAVTAAGRGCVAALALALVLHGSTKRPPVRGSAAPAFSPAPSAVRTAPSVAPVPGIPDPPEVPPGMCAATNWWRRGAFSGWRRVDFPAGWSFPWGTGRLRSAALLACGEVRPLGGDGPVASVGVPLGLPPLEGVLWYGPTPSNTYAFAWRNALAGRDRARPADARIELFRNGDVAVSTNGVTRRIPRELPFSHDGYGQDAEWVRANFANADEILSVGYSDWVDARVGTGLANGLYRFEAVFPEDPPEATRLVVGDLSVCVTNAGAYAFLLGKGREYRFRTEPHDGTVRYAVRDDVGAGSTGRAFVGLDSPAPDLAHDGLRRPADLLRDGVGRLARVQPGLYGEAFHRGQPRLLHTRQSFRRCLVRVHVFFPFCARPSDATERIHISQGNCP